MLRQSQSSLERANQRLEQVFNVNKTEFDEKKVIWEKQLSEIKDQID